MSTFTFMAGSFDSFAIRIASQVSGVFVGPNDGDDDGLIEGESDGEVVGL